MTSKVIFVFQNLPEYDISNLYLQYSFVFSFTNILLTIRQEQTSLFNNCITTQRRTHARQRAMPRAVFSFTNNNPFYHKQSILSGNNQSYFENNQSYLENNQSYFENNQSYLENNQSYFENNTILPILQS